VRQIRREMRLSLVAAACGLMLAACGGGGGGGNSEGRLQVINFTYPGGNTLLNGPTILSATTSSGLPVSFESGTPTTCTVSGNEATLIAAGECRIIARQEGGTGADGVAWAAADEVSHLFNVLKHAQTVTFAPPDYVLSAVASEVPLSATASSGLPVVFEVGTPTVCTITGNTLKLLGKGSCAVAAIQTGSAEYSEQANVRFVAVDPLVVADGFAAGSGRGSTDSMSTLQGGKVSVNPWASPLNAGWEWCDANAGGDWCYRTVSADGKSMTSSLHILDTQYTGGWQYSFNRIDIFVPGITSFNGSGDTTGGLQVTTEQSLVFTLGVNGDLYSAGKPLVVHLDLGKRNNGCNVTLSALLWPAAAGLVSYAIPLADFAVTDACGIAGVNAASLDNQVRALPNPNGASPSEAEAARKAYNDALAAFLPARESAMTLLLSSNIVRTRVRLMDANVDRKTNGVFASDLTISGAITLQ
jgi:hypothetical protein